MTPSTSHDSAIRTVAIRQHGNITHRQLRTIGLTLEAIRHRVRSGRLIRVHHCVYALGRPPRTPIERAAAAVLACGQGAALSHASAITLWGLCKHWDLPFEVVVSDDRRPHGIRIHRTRTLHRQDTTTQHGIRATTAARTLLDMSRRLTDKQLTRAVNEAIHLRQLRQSHPTDLLARHPRHPNASRLTPHLDTAKRGTTRSQLEHDFLTLCQNHNLPTPLTNHPIAGKTRDANALLAGHPTIRITDERMKTAPAEEAATLRKILSSLEPSRP